MTNLSWIVDSNELKRELKVKDVILMNDLEANAWGLRVLKQEDFYLLHAGTPGQTGNAALLSAGTGLGEAGLYWDGMEHRPFACEGGHTDFAPRNALEVEFFAYLTKLYPSHISYERVISGQGLVTIFRFLVETGREIPSQEVKKEMESRDPAAVISEWGNKQRDRACTHALEWFVSFYGAEAGNMALKLFSLGGVYLGGGIAPQILDTLKRGLFMKGFLSKGRFESLLKTMPIRIVLNDDAALLGAAEFIRRKK
jgi:glucokinase